jgi:uncharacterized alpha-E superfamily protein
MMTLQAVKEVVDQLSPAERAELLRYLEEEVSILLPKYPLSAEERIQNMDEAARAIREGFTDAEWEEVVAAMNEEYIEPVDEDGFPLS